MVEVIAEKSGRPIDQSDPFSTLTDEVERGERLMERKKTSVASKRANVTILQNAMQGSASLDTVASWLKYIYPYGPQKVIPASISLQ